LGFALTCRGIVCRIKIERGMKMPFNIAPYLHENLLGILTAANGNLTSRHNDFGAIPGIMQVGYDFTNLRANARLNNSYDWTQQIAEEQVIYRHDINLQHIVHGNPTIGATSCFVGYNNPNPLTLATLGRLTGCTALVLVLRNGVLSLHAGNDGAIDGTDFATEVYQAGNGSLQRAYRGWLYQLVWNHLAGGSVQLDPGNVNVMDRVGMDTFQGFIDPIVFANSLLQLDTDFTKASGGQQILWGNLVHINRDVVPIAEERIAGTGQRQIFIEMYDTNVPTAGGLYYLINTPPGNPNAPTVSTLSCRWRYTNQAALILNDATLTSRVIHYA